MKLREKISRYFGVEHTDQFRFNPEEMAALDKEINFIQHFTGDLAGTIKISVPEQWGTQLPFGVTDALLAWRIAWNIASNHVHYSTLFPSTEEFFAELEKADIQPYLQPRILFALNLLLALDPTYTYEVSVISLIASVRYHISVNHTQYNVIISTV